MNESEMEVVLGPIRKQFRAYVDQAGAYAGGPGAGVEYRKLLYNLERSRKSYLNPPALDLPEHLLSDWEKEVNLAADSARSDIEEMVQVWKIQTGQLSAESVAMQQDRQRDEKEIEITNQVQYKILRRIRQEVEKAKKHTGNGAFLDFKASRQVVRDQVRVGGGKARSLDPNLKPEDWDRTLEREANQAFEAIDEMERIWKLNTGQATAELAAKQPEVAGDAMAAAEKLDELLTLVEELQVPKQHSDNPIPPEEALHVLERARTEAMLFAGRLSGKDSDYYAEISKPVFQQEHRNLYDEIVHSELHQARTRLISNLSALLIESRLPDNTSAAINEGRKRRYNNRVFIVHGHNKEMQKAVEDYIGELGLDPIILHKKPSEGGTIIEKFEKHSDVGFAIGLLSPDDFTRRPRLRKLKRCPRQNVILETGFFIGKLGRNKVLLLVKDRAKLEYPSDYDGVIYTTYDNSGSWRTELALELKHADYVIDQKFLPASE